MKFNLHTKIAYFVGAILLADLIYWSFIIPHALLKTDPKLLIQFVHEAGYVLGGLGIGTIGSIALPRLFQYFETKNGLTGNPVKPGGSQ